MANAKKQTLQEAYAEPANFLEIDVCNPQTHGFGRGRYTDYEVHTRVRSFPCVAGTRISPKYCLIR